MKILHIVPTYLPAYRYGGPIKSVHELNKWLVKSGVDVTVYTTDINGHKNLDVPKNQPVLIDGVKVFYFPVTWRFWQYSSAMCRALRKDIKDFNLVHITSVFLSASTLGAYYSKKFKKPYVISPRGSLMKEPFYKGYLKKKFYMCLIEKRNLKNAGAIHFTADIEKQEYISLGFPIPGELIIPNGLDFDELKVGTSVDLFLEKFGIPKNKKIVLFLSRLSWKKGIDKLIPAFTEVIKKEPEAILVLVGGNDEGYKKEILKMMAKNRLSERKEVFFTGELGAEDKNAAYKSGQFFILPSYAENFGLVLGESLIAGATPVITTAQVGMAPFIKKYEAGIVVKLNTVSDLVDAMLELFKNPEEAKKMGERAATRQTSARRRYCEA